MKTVHMTCALVLAQAIAPAARAGRPCEEKKASVRTVERGLEMAQRTLAALNASGAQVVILARAGQDLTKYGLHYSHLGFAYRQPAPDGTAPVWRVVHELNQCGTAESAIYRQGLAEFFLDDLWRYDGAWVVPTREVQERLLPVLQDDRRAVGLHQNPYSVVSYAWGRKYQQSNQWALETLAATMEPAAVTRERAQAWLQFKGYEPTTLMLGPLTRLGGRMTAANVAFDDHPNEKRFSDRIETVTVDSIFAWLQRTGLAGSPVTLRLP